MSMPLKRVIAAPDAVCLACLSRGPSDTRPGYLTPDAVRAKRIRGKSGPGPGMVLPECDETTLFAQFHLLAQRAGAAIIDKDAPVHGDHRIPPLALRERGGARARGQGDDLGQGGQGDAVGLGPEA